MRVRRHHVLAEVARLVRVGQGLLTYARLLKFAAGSQRQLGNQISMLQVFCEIGCPVSTGNSQAKFVNTSAT
jgi:hypothetical protein